MKNRKTNMNKPRAKVHKRRSKDAAKRELIRQLESIGVGFDALSVGGGDIYSSRGGRKEGKYENAVGVFSSAKGGYGFVTPEGGGTERDIFIPEGKTLGAISGDLVECTYKVLRGYTGSEKTEGRVTKIVKIGKDTVVGTLLSERRRGRVEYFVEPSDTRLSVRPVVRDPYPAVAGDKVSVKICRGTGVPGSPLSEIVSVFGRSDTLSANYEAILDECEIPREFTEEELLFAEAAAKKPIDADRVRYTGAPVFTIDGAGAKDLDDAVSLRKTAAGWLLGVHIADVSEYVAEKSPLDRCVMKRGTSVYFTDKVVPMLPPVLSNGVCSLHPGEDKCTLSAMISLDRNGTIVSCKLVPTVINSSVRGVYSEVNELLSGSASAEIKEKYKKVYPSLLKMRELYEVLYKNSSARGNLELEIPEAEIILDGNGDPCEVTVRERGVSERMIEQFMLTANEAVASLLRKEGIPCVYRVHEQPPEDRLSDFVNYLHNLGFDTSYISHKAATQHELSRVLCEAKERGRYEAVSYSMLRSMSKAYYSELPKGHFGLALENYCHFTSPIRRLSDLATHRIIHRRLLDGNMRFGAESYAVRAARAASDCEERALSAERKIEDLYKAVYMSRHIGETFSARVSSVHSFGVFARLENTCEGLLPLSLLPGYFEYDEKNLSVRSASSVIRLGDVISVRVASVDISRGKIEFSLVL